MDPLYEKASSSLKKALAPYRPKLAIVLGSALGSLSEQVDHPLIIPYQDIPGLKLPTNESHKGVFVVGRLGQKDVLLLAGRVHHYEGYSEQDLVFPIRLLSLIGIETLILTNAAGGINPKYKVGDFMLLSDHIKLLGPSPLRGPNLDAFGPRFPDMSEVYRKDLRSLALKAAQDLGMQDRVHEGVYFYMPGPQFETPAEIRAIALLGGDSVGMSTVYEAIAAAHQGLSVLGISFISNQAAGLSGEKITDDEVLVAGQEAATRFSEFVQALVHYL